MKNRMKNRPEGWTWIDVVTTSYTFAVIVALIGGAIIQFFCLTLAGHQW